MNISQAQKAARTALEKYHYTDACTITQLQKVTDDKTKLTKQQEVTVLEDQPCKLSFETVKNTESSDTAAALAQSTKLFLAPEVKISPGSKILVTHQGETIAYEQSGKAAVYPTHQEVFLTLSQRWA